MITIAPAFLGGRCRGDLAGVVLSPRGMAAPVSKKQQVQAWLTLMMILLKR
jgi:hypothetical protein